jgi:hypothetical protein
MAAWRVVNNNGFPRRKSRDRGQQNSAHRPNVLSSAFVVFFALRCCSAARFSSVPSHISQFSFPSLQLASNNRERESVVNRGNPAARNNRVKLHTFASNSSPISFGCDSLWPELSEWNVAVHEPGLAFCRIAEFTVSTFCVHSVFFSN